VLKTSRYLILRVYRSEQRGEGPVACPEANWFNWERSNWSPATSDMRTHVRGSPGNVLPMRCVSQ